MKAKQHIHKYIRHKFHNGKIAFRCALPNCNHYLPREFVVGKYSICWKCDNVFEMTRHSIRLKKPHCNCVRPKQRDHIDELVRGLFS